MSNLAHPRVGVRTVCASRLHQTQCAQRCRMHPSGVLGIIVEVVSGARSSASARLKPLCTFTRLSSPATSAGTGWSPIYFT
eukprot:15430367-Alexandrium_andersonii.AAC.1